MSDETGATAGVNDPLELAGRRMASISDNRPIFLHHLVLSVYAGFILGLVSAVLRGWQGIVLVDAEPLAGVGMVLGGLNAIPLWFVIRGKPSSATAFALSAGAIGVGIAEILLAGPWARALFPVITLWFGAFLIWRYMPDEPGPGYCHTCGYNLRGLTRPICPECGTRFDPAELDHRGP